MVYVNRIVKAPKQRIEVVSAAKAAEATTSEKQEAESVEVEEKKRGRKTKDAE
jgi:hypothetical protein